MKNNSNHSRYFSILLVLVLIVSLFSPAPVRAAISSKAKISKSKLTMYLYDTAQLSISSASEPVWLSTDPDTAKIDSNGNITAENIGNCTIYGIIGSTAYKCDVTVVEAPKIVMTDLNASDLKVSPIPACETKASSAASKLYKQNSLSETVSTVSSYKSPYNSKSAVKGRTPIYFYHPRKLQLTDRTANVMF